MHRCIGPKSNHDDITRHSDTSVLALYNEHREPGWYEKTLKYDSGINPHSLRRWMRMVTQEAHRRHLV